MRRQQQQRRSHASSTGRLHLRDARSFDSITARAPYPEIPLPVAEVAPDGTVVWSNAAWRVMASTVGADPAVLADATGLDAAWLNRLLHLLHATIESPPPAGTSNTIELDVPNLGLNRWSRCYGSAATGPGRALLTIVPLRLLPTAGNGPDPESFVTAYEYLSEGIVVLDERMRIHIATGFATSLMGQPGFEYAGRDAIDEIHVDDRERAVAQFAKILTRAGEQAVVELRVRDSGGTYRWLEAVATNLFDHPIVGGMLVMLRDIGERKRLEAELAHRALHDPLTDLPNRAAIIHRLTDAIDRQTTSEHSLAVMFLDLDNLKDVNDSVGHDAGDALLVEVARRLRAACAPSDIVGRLAGDEFVVVCPYVADDALERAERIRRAITGRSVVGVTDVFVSASIGVVVVPPGSRFDETPDESALRLLREADTAMYQAKLRGRASVVLFSEDMNERAQLRVQLTAALDRAISENRLELRYEPVFRLDGTRPTGIEASVHWNDPEFGEVEPSRFLEVAESSGLTVPLAMWTLDRALADLADLRRSSPEFADLLVGVGMAPGQVGRPDAVDRITACLAAHRLEPDALVVQISESHLFDGDGLRSSVARLRAAGVHVAIDGFGTGRSPIAELRRLAAGALKLDPSFVADLSDSDASAEVCRAVIQLAHAAGLRVVAKGITSVDQLGVLLGSGCDYGQGPLLSRPRRATEIATALTGR